MRTIQTAWERCRNITRTLQERDQIREVKSEKRPIVPDKTMLISSFIPVIANDLIEIV
jgi:hypothetical protein